MRRDHERIERELHSHRAEKRGSDHQYSRDYRRAQHSARSADTAFVSPEKCRDDEREDEDGKTEREIAMCYLDYEIDAIVRRKPRAGALRPVIAAAHSRSRDANDRAEHDLGECQNEGGEGKFS